MKFPTPFSSSLFCITLVLFQGCTVVGPNYEPAALPTLPQKYNQNLTKSDPKILEWWKQFNDPTLDILVQKAYEQNLDLESASTRILQARAALGLSESLTTPQKRTLSASALQLRENGRNFNTANVGFDMGWELDVWGQYARGVESSEASYYASIASYDHILVTLIGEVARNYINYRTAQERMEYARQNIAIQRRIVRMTQVQYNSGVVSELDTQQASAQLYALETTIPAFELQSTQAINALSVLLGSIPEKIKPLIPPSIPQSLPKSTSKKQTFVLLDNEALEHSAIALIKLDTTKPINASDLLKRPDLQIAEFQARASNAQIGVKQADLYPHFSLLGSIGYNTNNLGGSWTSSSNAISIGIGPSISWNPFYPDFYQNQVRIADAQFQESLIHYNQTVLNAIEEVTNAQEGYKLTLEQYALNQKALHASIRAFNLSSIQYDNGMVTYQRLLSTMESATKIQDTLAITRGNISLHAIALYKALGGGLKLTDNQSYLRAQTAETMKKRTDWGNYLDSNQTIHPKVKP